MTKKVAAYSEILYHLINFRTDQFQQLKKMLGIDYDSFMILSVMGAHYLKHSDKLGSDWEVLLLYHLLLLLLAAATEDGKEEALPNLILTYHYVLNNGHP